MKSKVRLPFSLAVTVCIATVVYAQQKLPENVPLRKGRSTFSQELKIEGGALRSGDSQKTLPPLRNAILGASTDKLQSKTDKEALVDRMNAMQDAVNKAKSAQEPWTSVSVINELKQSIGNQQLKDDLDKMLIASLVTSIGKAVDDNNAPTGELNTRIWSYRRLNNEVKNDDGTVTVENWGPTLVAHPGEVLLIPVLNLLSRDELAEATVPATVDRPTLQIPRGVPTSSTATGSAMYDNSPHDFDVTNLHTHGLNVSPDWPSDDIFRQIHPGQLKFYIYAIPANHPTGTFFYHPHHHGSVATQVAGGMAGALLITNPHTTTVTDLPNDLDEAGIRLFWTDVVDDAYPGVLLLQQLSLFQDNDPTSSSKDTLFTRPDFFAMKDTGPWTDGVAANEHWVTQSDRPMLARLAKILIKRPDGTSYDDVYNSIKRFSVTTWANGRFLPTLQTMESNAIHRLRLIHAGVEANVSLRMGWKPNETTPLYVKDPQDATKYVLNNNVLDDIQYQVIARDGIPLPVPQQVGSVATNYKIPGDTGTLTIAPGNRADVLISTPARKVDGALELYYMVDDVPQTIATIRISGTCSEEPQRKFLDIELAKHVYDLQAPKLTGQRGQKHDSDPDVTADIDHSFELTFADAKSLPPADAESESEFQAGTFEVNHKSFPGDVHQFALNTDSTILFAVKPDTPHDPNPDLDADWDKHPFHIHVNPFLVPAAETDEEKGRRISRGLPLSEFWTDTLLVYEYEPVIATMPFHQWTGRFVGHCHILDHEDAGMMSKLRIDPPATGFPAPPSGGLMSILTPPQDALNAIVQEAPNYQGPIAGSDQNQVTAIVFMPKLPTGACPHCAESVQAIVALRKATAGLALRIIAITNADGPDLPLFDDLQLDSNTDLLCSDASLDAFEVFGLIDSTPDQTPYSASNKFEFSSAFYPGSRQLKHETDLLHGLFIVKKDGTVYSERRGFEAFDETKQIIEEVKSASMLQSDLKQQYDRILSETTNTALKSRLQRSFQYLQVREKTDPK